PQFICVTIISRTIPSRAKSVTTPTRRKRSRIIISESLAQWNDRLKSRAAGESSRSEVRFGETPKPTRETRALPSRIQKCRRLYDVDLGRGVEFRFANRKLVTG